MKKPLFLMLSYAVLLTGCATTDPMEQIRREEAMAAAIEETREYLRAVNPEKVPYVRFKEPLRYEYLSNLFVIVKTKAGSFLLEFARNCKELGGDNVYTDMADQRYTKEMLRAGSDTVRGCRIKEIYKLPEAAGGKDEDE